MDNDPLPHLPPSPWGNPSPSVTPWAGNHLKACKDHNHSGLCPIREQYRIKRYSKEKESAT